MSNQDEEGRSGVDLFTSGAFTPDVWSTVTAEALPGKADRDLIARFKLIGPDRPIPVHS